MNRELSSLEETCKAREQGHLTNLTTFGNFEGETQARLHTLGDGVFSVAAKVRADGKEKKKKKRGRAKSAQCTESCLSFFPSFFLSFFFFPLFVFVSMIWWQLVHYGDQLEAVNAKRQRAIEAKAMMAHIAAFEEVRNRTRCTSLRGLNPSIFPLPSFLFNFRDVFYFYC